MNPVVGLLIAAIVVIMIFWLGSKSSHKRSSALREVASSLNFNYSEHGSDTVLVLLKDFKLLSGGFLPMVSNVMGGPYQDINVIIADYLIQLNRFKTINQTVFVLYHDQLRLPSFELSPKNLGNKVMSGAGSKAISFEQHPSFSDKYILKGSDENAICNLFSSTTLSYLEEHDDIFIEGTENMFLVFKDKHLMPPELMSTFLDEIIGLFPVVKSTAGFYGNSPDSTGIEMEQSSQDELLPKDVKCPACGEDLELEDDERKSMQFTCPSCGKFNDLRR